MLRIFIDKSFLFKLQDIVSGMFHSEPQQVDVVEQSGRRPYSISVVHEHGYGIAIPIPSSQLAPWLEAKTPLLFQSHAYSYKPGATMTLG